MGHMCKYLAKANPKESMCLLIVLIMKYAKMPFSFSSVVGFLFLSFVFHRTGDKKIKRKERKEKSFDIEYSNIPQCRN